MPEDTPRQTRQLVLVGGGHAHVAVLKAFGMQRIPEVRLVLVSDHWDTPYSGMLPGMIAGHHSRDEIHVDLHRLCRFAGGEFYRDRVTGLDLKAKKLQLAEHLSVHFDLLSINTGSTPTRAGIPGADRYAIPVKPIDVLLTRLAELEQRFLAAHGRPFQLVTVGGGAGGVELTLSVQHRLQQLAAKGNTGNPGLECTIATASRRILPGHNSRVQSKFERLLLGRSVRVLTGSPVMEVTASEVVCGNGHRLPYDALLWATHAAAPDWPRAAGLAVDDSGFIAVGPTLQSTSHDFVFAAGDVAALVKNPRPKSGVFAVRQGPPLARNLRLALLGFSPRRHRPQRTFLSLISTGDRNAVASKGPFAASGRMLWRWKQRIDRQWMRQYRELPVMKESGAEMDYTARMKRNLRTGDDADPALSRRMRCGGCGAKISGLVLHEALKQLHIEPNPSVMIGLNAPDDAAVFSPPPGRLLVQSVDFFRTLVNDPWLFGRIAAAHALNDLHAKGAVPLVAQATVTLELAGSAIMIERLAQMLGGASRQLADAGATLVGGHSAEGKETGIGFSVTGTIGGSQLMRKTGLRAGDRLVLTKPLGTGVLFAADMEFKLCAGDLSRVVEGMLRSNAAAAAVFQRAGVSVCTDLSGFGLLGHLRETLAGTNRHIRLSPFRPRAYDGVIDLIRAGHESTMALANAHYLNLTDAGPALRKQPEIRLLLDPQTSGPLLAAVPEAQVEGVLSELQESGYEAAVEIGEVLEGSSSCPILLEDS